MYYFYLHVSVCSVILQILFIIEREVHQRTNILLLNFLQKTTKECVKGLKDSLDKIHPTYVMK